MNVKQHVILGFVVSLFCFFALPFSLNAACTYAPQDDAIGSLISLYNENCLGSSKDSHPLVQKIQEKFDKTGLDHLKKLETAIITLQEIQKFYQPVDPGKPNPYGPNTSVGTINELEKNLRVLTGKVIEEISLSQASSADLNRISLVAETNVNEDIDSINYANPGYWFIDRNSLIVTLNRDIDNGGDSIVLDFIATYLDNNCTAPDSPQCSEAFSRASNGIRHVEMVRQTLDFAFRNMEFTPLVELAKLRVSQWNQYFQKGYPQWPWELWANGLLYKRNITAESGLVQPPDWQLVLLHPDVIFEYVDKAEDGDQFKPTLMVELIGVDVWSWDEKGRQIGPWNLPFSLGVGLIGTYMDRAEIDDFGIGGIVRINHSYNFGVTTRGGGEVGVFFSLNLSKLITSGMGTAKTYFGL